MSGSRPALLPARQWPQQSLGDRIQRLRNKVPQRHLEAVPRHGLQCDTRLPCG